MTSGTYVPEESERLCLGTRPPSKIMIKPNMLLGIKDLTQQVKSGRFEDVHADIRRLDEALSIKGNDLLFHNLSLKGVLEMLGRSEEQTSELQSLMRISYAVFCLKKKKPHTHNNKTNN